MRLAATALLLLTCACAPRDADGVYRALLRDHARLESLETAGERTLTLPHGDEATAEYHLRLARPNRVWLKSTAADGVAFSAGCDGTRLWWRSDGGGALGDEPFLLTAPAPADPAAVLEQLDLVAPWPPAARLFFGAGPPPETAQAELMSLAEGDSRARLLRLPGWSTAGALSIELAGTPPTVQRSQQPLSLPEGFATLSFTRTASEPGAALPADAFAPPAGDATEGETLEAAQAALLAARFGHDAGE